MNKMLDSFTAAQKTNMQAAEGMATQAYAGAEKFVELNMAATKAAVSESFAHMQALMGAKDVKDVVALQTAFLQPMAAKSAAYIKHAQTIATEGSTELTTAVKGQVADAQKAMNEAVEGLAKNAPAGSEAAMAAFKNAVTASQGAMETAQASMKKAGDAAQASFTTASKQAMDMAKKATNKAA
jgi:phasin family protein